ncbi:hypothetical protein [Rhodothermus marinus]|uniref:hypothetical protein n=1 Tax=Rhodothermus marinus TaxID=29549 RepID=UPI001FB360B0|nr:hypothetical protein [Rhodothermus marinus]
MPSQHLQRLRRQMQELVEDLRAWVELRLTLTQLEIEERIEARIRQLLLRLLVGMLAGLAVVFALVAAALGLGSWLGHPLGLSGGSAGTGRRGCGVPFRQEGACCAVRIDECGIG